MALILNLETSSENCSVALSNNGVVVGASQNEEKKSHASVLTILIEELLRNNSVSFHQLHAISVSKGPGSYTGLRIGVSVAKGLCYGTGKPLIGLNTLACMMNGLKIEVPDFDLRFDADTVFCPMLDARRQEVYTAAFDKQGIFLRDTSADIIDEYSYQDTLESHPVVFFGSGAEKCKSLIKSHNAVFVDNFQVKASYMATLSEVAFKNKEFEDVAYFEPFYLKDFVATTPKRKVI